MKYPVRSLVFIQSVLLGLCTCRVAAAADTLLFVAPDGLGTSCTLTQPCALETAQAQVRGATATMTGDISVRLLDGSYRLGRELLFDAAQHDGGENGHRVVYEAQPGAQPVISAGLVVSDWVKQTASPLWIARVPEGFDTRQLYVNGVRATRARGPLPSALDDLPGIGYQAHLDVLSHWQRPQDLELVYDFEWKRVRCGVASVSDKLVVMDQPCFDNASRGTAATLASISFIENALELLDEPGEWYLDSERGRIFYWPQPWEDPSSAQAVAANLDSLVRGVGTPSAPLRNLTLRGLTFAHAGWIGASGEDGFCELQANHRLTGEGAYRNQGSCQAQKPPGLCPLGDWTPTPANLSFTATDNLLIERNTFTHLGGVGLRLGDYVTNTRVIGNVFRDISGNGLDIGQVDRIGADDPGPLPSDNVISNNWISEVGVEYSGAVGLFQGYTQRSVVEHNQLNALPYTGISSGWGWGFHQSGTSGNAIRANLVFDHVQLLQDGGGVYTLGNQGSSIADGSEVAFNYVHGQRNNGFSLYTDAGSRYMTLHHNILFDNYVTRDVGGCFVGNGTTMGDMLVSENWWQVSPPTWDCLAIPPDTFEIERNQPLVDVNESPSAIRETAGLEPAYADIRGDAASSFNLAYRKPCRVSDPQAAALALQPGHGCGASLDGDATSYAAAQPDSPWQLDIDLLDLQDVDRLRLLLPPSAAKSSVQVQLSVDGAVFVTAKSSVSLTPGLNTISFAPRATRFVRVNAPAKLTPLAFAEIGVYGRPDNALHKNASAEYVDGSPASMQAGLLPALAVDGLGATHSQASGEWRWTLRVDLGSTRPIDRVIVTAPAGAYATAYHIDGSLDGEDWRTLVQVLDGKQGSRALDFEQAQARHLRIVADKPDDYGQPGGQMAIARFSAYGPPDAISGAAVRAEALDGSPVTPLPDGAADRAIDGNLRTQAQPQAQWRWRLHVDLGRRRSLHQVDVLMPAAAFATAFHIDSALDRETWETQARVNTVGVGGLVHVLLPESCSGRYLRVVADAPDGAGQVGQRMAITELTVY